VSSVAAAFEPKGDGKVLWAELYRAFLKHGASMPKLPLSHGDSGKPKPWQTDGAVKKALAMLADELHHRDSEVCAVIERLDREQSGVIERGALEAAILGISAALSRTDVALVVKAFDTSGNGLVNWEALYGELWCQGQAKATQRAASARAAHDCRSASDWREIDAILREESTRVQTSKKGASIASASLSASSRGALRAPTSGSSKPDALASSPSPSASASTSFHSMVEVPHALTYPEAAWQKRPRVSHVTCSTAMVSWASNPEAHFEVVLWKEPILNLVSPALEERTEAVLVYTGQGTHIHLTNLESGRAYTVTVCEQRKSSVARLPSVSFETSTVPQKCGGSGMVAASWTRWQPAWQPTDYRISADEWLRKNLHSFLQPPAQAVPSLQPSAHPAAVPSPIPPAPAAATATIEAEKGPASATCAKAETAVDEPALVAAELHLASANPASEDRVEAAPSSALSGIRTMKQGAAATIASARSELEKLQAVRVKFDRSHSRDSCQDALRIRAREAIVTAERELQRLQKLAGQSTSRH
jgi:hypothetical protein